MLAVRLPRAGGRRSRGGAIISPGWGLGCAGWVGLGLGLGGLGGWAWAVSLLQTRGVGAINIRVGGGSGVCPLDGIFVIL